MAVLTAVVIFAVWMFTGAGLTFLRMDRSDD